MTRRLAVLTFAALALTVIPAGAHEGAATVDCDRATFAAVGFGEGEHHVTATLTVETEGEPGLTAELATHVIDGDTGTVAWDVSDLTDRPGLLDLTLDVAWDAHGGGTAQATASHVCVEPATTTTTPKSPPTTPKPTVTVTATTPETTTTTTVVPAADTAGPPELPRTGTPYVPLTAGLLILAVGALAVTLTRRERTR